MEKNYHILPSNISLEEVVLGSFIIDEDCLNEHMYLLNETIFFIEKNKIVYNCIENLYKSNKKVDLMTVFNEIKVLNKINKVPIIYLSSLVNKVTNTANVEAHIRILQEHSLKRNIINSCNKAIIKSFDESIDAFDAFDFIQKELDSTIKNVVNDNAKQVNKIHNEIIMQTLEYINNGIKSGVETNLINLDKVTNGFQNSDLIIIAGRPSMGKTAFAISMCVFPCIYNNIPIAIFSLEMSDQQLVSRLQSILSEVNVSKIVKKQLTNEELNIIISRSKKLNTAPLYIDDTPNISISDLRAKCKRLVKEKGVKMIVIDYLQLMRGTNKNGGNREQEIAEISRGLKTLAKELNLPVIALSQLSRIVESRSDKKPMLSDLRESGQIEQDADMVIFCYRPEYYDIQEYTVGNTSFESKGLFMAIVAKHRNGELGEIALKFIGDQTKIDNLKTQNYVNLPINNKINLKHKEIDADVLNEFYETNKKDDMPF